MCLFQNPSTSGAINSPFIPGLSVDADARQSRIHGKTSTQPLTVNDQLSRAFEKKTASKGSDKQHAVRTPSADRSDKSGDVTFTEADSPFHLWYPAAVRIDHSVYESAGHYLVMKSLGNASQRHS